MSEQQITPSPPNVKHEKDAHLINIKVTDGINEHYFKIRKPGQLKKLMDRFCDILEYPRDHASFFFGFTRLKPTDSPVSLEMQDGSTIEVHVEKLSEQHITPSPPNVKHEKKDTHLINIKVTDGINERKFKIKKTGQLKKLMNCFCDIFGYPKHHVRFFFDGTGLKPTDSPVSLEMRDGSTIEIHVEKHINIKVTDGTNKRKFMITETDQLKKLMDCFCAIVGHPRDHVSFFFGSTRLKPKDSPVSLDMQDGSTIEVHVKKLPGA